MRIEGKHSSGAKVVIYKNESGILELYSYNKYGALIYEDSFKSINLAKSHARKKCIISGRWHWDVRIKLKGQI